MPNKPIGRTGAADAQAESFEFELLRTSVYRGCLLNGQVSQWSCRVQRLSSAATSTAEMISHESHSRHDASLLAPVGRIPRIELQQLELSESVERYDKRNLL